MPSRTEPPPTLRSERLTLRAPRQEDAARVAELCGDPGVSRNTARMPHPYTPADAAWFIEAVLTQDPEQDRAFMIETAEDGVVGCLGFHKGLTEGWPSDGLFAEAGYWFGRPWWGRGYASEALTTALGWAGRKRGDNGWGRRAFIAGHFADNAASGRVLEKTGFLYTGAVVDRHSVARGETARTRMMAWLA